MKQLKSVNNIDSNVKNRVRNALKIIRNNKGVTLVELLVTAAIGIFVSMGIASVFVFAMQQFTILVEKNAAEENALQITYYLRQYLSQAVDVNAVTAVGAALPGGTGQIDVNFRLLDQNFSGVGAADSGEFVRFAVFNREAGTYNNAAGGMPMGGSDLRKTAIFIKDTSPASSFPDASSGAVVFDFNTETGVIVPEASDLFYSRIHDFQVQRVNCPGAGGLAAEVVEEASGRLWPCLPAGWAPAGGVTYKIKTITVVIATRYFKSATKGDWNYRAPVGGAPTAPYRDIVQTVKINFKNNSLTQNSLVGRGSEERVHGSLYFYDYIMPATRF